MSSQRLSGGDKRSSWLTFQRCMVVMRRLMRGSATAAELIAAAEAELGGVAYPGNAAVALRQDIGRLRDDFGCTIRFRADEGYRMLESGMQALLDLPEQHLHTIMFLHAIFTADSLPQATEVMALLNYLTELLPEERQKQLTGPGRDRVEYPPALEQATSAVLARLRKVLGKHMLRFSYRSSFAGEALIVHRVAPYALLHRDGHTYLRAFCHESDGKLRQKYQTYRVDRIIPESIQVLPQQLPPAPPPERVYFIRYVLSPRVAAQHDIALWFGDSRVTTYPDGSLEIIARTDDLWQARQFLLRYREQCRVLEPLELVEMMRESVFRMAALYRMEDEQTPASHI